MMKISAFYLVKQKSFIPKKQYDLGRSHYQNKKALFTDSIFQKVLGRGVSPAPSPTPQATIYMAPTKIVLSEC